jgi:GAF domain-containing protein
VNGYEMLAAMKASERLRHIPVIMISAVDEIDSVIRCIELGAEDYLAKPFNPTLLRARVGACLERKRLHDEVAARTRELSEALEQQTATSEVLGVISSSPGDLQPVFETILANATSICEAKFGSMYLNEGGAVRIVAMHNAPPSFAEERRRNPLICPSPDTTLGRALATKQTVQIADVRNEPDYSDAPSGFTGSKLAKLAGARTVLAVPMVKESELVGAILIYRQEVRPFTDKQIELVSNFATQAVIAIENTRLLNELRQRTDDLSEALEQQTATSEVLRVISVSPGELDAVFQRVLENATRLCEAKFGTLYLREGQAFRLVAHHNAPAAYVEERRQNLLLCPIPGSALGRMVATKQPAQIADVQAEPVYQSDPVRAGFLRNSFSSGTTSVLRAVFASRDETMASAPALPEATVSGQFVQIFGRKENPRGGDVLVKVRHR